MSNFYIGLAVFVVAFIAAMSPLGTSWTRDQADWTDVVCLKVQLETGNFKRITIKKPPYAGLGVSHGGRSGYYLSTWGWTRFMFIPVRAGEILMWGVIDFDVVPCAS